MTTLSWQAIKQITRIDNLSVLIMLWPTYWALWVASDGLPDGILLLIFTMGVVIMRSAGCVINDFADRKVDAK